MSKASTWVIAALLLIIAVMAWVLWVKPVEAPAVPGSEQVVSPDDPRNAAVAKPVAPAALHERVVVSFPKVGAAVSRNFTVTGEAPGNWFFEGSAPMMVRDPEGSKIAQGIITAQGDWMTTGLVKFSGDLKVNLAYSGPAVLVLLKDNPSGLPEHDDSLEISIEVQ
jgi:Immunoglobulin-like domain of bacterial spore germination